MGLTISHDCYQGSCTSFNYYRAELQKALGMPPLKLMEGYYNPRNVFETVEAGISQPNAAQKALFDAIPFNWEALEGDPILELMLHSDCEGSIPWENCLNIADTMEYLLQKLPGIGEFGSPHTLTVQFIAGLEEAFKNKEDVEFH